MITRMARCQTERTLAGGMSGFKTFGLAAMLFSTILFFDQSSAIRVLQASDGTLYLIQDADAWTMQPSAIADSDLAALTPSGELDGAIPAPFLSSATLAPLEAVQTADTSLYLVQGSNVWTLVPLVASDEDIAALNVVGSLAGTIAAPGLGAPPAEALPPIADQPPLAPPAPAGDLTPPAPPSPGPVARPTVPPAPPANALKIVSSLPRTGADKSLTDTIVNAIGMAVDEHNNQVLGQPLAYVDMDGATAAKGKWDAAQEASNANRALNDPTVLAYIGPLDTGAAMVAIPILCAAHMVMVSPGATSVWLTRPTSDPNYPNAPDVFYPHCPRNFARLAPADDLEHSTPSDWSNQLNAKGHQWYQSYTTQFGAAPDIHALYSYEAANVILNAVQHVGTNNRAAIRDALFGTSNFDGVLGTWSMTPTGDTSHIQAPLPGSR